MQCHALLTIDLVLDHLTQYAVYSLLLPFAIYFTAFSVAGQALPQFLSDCRVLQRLLSLYSIRTEHFYH